MKRNLTYIMFTFLLLLLATDMLRAQTIHRITVKSAGDKQVSMASFRGKKIVIVTVDAACKDSIMDQLAGIRHKYDAKVQLVLLLMDGLAGVPPRSMQKDTVQNGTGEKGSILSLDMAGQKTVIDWLSKKENNGHFTVEIKEGGQKFFINETGQLYAVLGPRTSFNSPVMEKLLK